MRIAFITFEYPPFIIGGAGVYALNVTRELAKLGHQVVVFTPDISENRSQSNLLNLEIRKVHVNNELPFKALQFWLRLPKEIRCLEKNNRFDILHFNGISYWFLKNRLSKAKHIVTVHHLVKDAMMNNNPNFISRIKDISGENGFFVSIFERKCIKYSDKLVAVSNFTKKQIIESYHLDPAQIEIIYNGADFNGYSCTKEEISNYKKQLNLSERPVILFVGRVDDPRKGLDFLVNSIKRVLDITDITLLIVGKGDQTKIRELISSLGISSNVVFTGFIDEKLLKICYLLCDIYVCSSKLEGFGLTIVEAMLAGKPIVATKVGAIPEILDEKINGILVEPDDIVCMSDAIIKLVKNKDLAINIGEINAEYAINNFNWNRNAIRLNEIYTVCQSTNDAQSYCKD